MKLFRDGIEETIDGTVKVRHTREGHVIEAYKVGGANKYFVTLAGSHYCAHGNTVADAVADALWKDPSKRPSLEMLKTEIVAAGPSRKITLREFRLLTGACEAGCQAAIRQSGVSESAMTAYEIRDRINRQWGNKLLAVLGWKE